jgi:hypothetical protein
MITQSIQHTYLFTLPFLPGNDTHFTVAYKYRRFYMYDSQQTRLKNAPRPTLIVDKSPARICLETDGAGRGPKTALINLELLLLKNAT